MDFAFINDLVNKLSTTNIFTFTFIGAKLLALLFLLLRLMDVITKDNMDGNIKIGNSFATLGFGFIIMSSDWVIKGIENAFSAVDKTMSFTQSDLYTQLTEQLYTKYNEIFTDAFSANSILDPLAVLETFLMYSQELAFIIFAGLIAGLCKIADLSITAGYLLQRIFIVKLLQFLFPLAIAFSTSTQLGKFFYSWIMRYIGTFILGIAYIGIIKFTALVSTSLMNQFDTGKMSGAGGYTSMSIYSFGLLVTVIVTFTIKVKLFQSVTNYINSMFQ
ncbi:hypothetical protein [Elizabethkingia anophelis]|uniref:hypothetical protein n=1 Tax=Elizabethkingia anophelis TaxID=1117645 RepID=UPI0002ABD56A|nr:hypothetical protein [Elizabethkingia anophelis]ELR81113.1 hypothetical protein D505_01095 [Elizabethkingia anophelis R26]MCS7369691.1 hypothetical protein [Elizabethkingia anophelis]MCS7375008.1 hypothetical protein [Elizabethkingia anophelis]MCS7387335.1 hypothetical protein [Elizabethkingia anophelis]MDV4026035.1 hypothetical protein [Elizabethkingia anophelis]